MARIVILEFEPRDISDGGAALVQSLIGGSQAGQSHAFMPGNPGPSLGMPPAGYVSPILQPPPAQHLLEPGPEEAITVQPIEVERQPVNQEQQAARPRFALDRLLLTFFCWCRGLSMPSTKTVIRAVITASALASLVFLILEKRPEGPPEPAPEAEAPAEAAPPAEPVPAEAAPAPAGGLSFPILPRG